MTVKKMSWRRSNQALFLLFFLCLIPTNLFSSEVAAFAPDSSIPWYEQSDSVLSSLRLEGSSLLELKQVFESAPPLVKGTVEHLKDPMHYKPNGAPDYRFLLLYGESGAGKSTLAKAIAQYANWDLVFTQPFLHKLSTSFEQFLAKHPEMLTSEGSVFKAPLAVEETSILKSTAEKVKGSIGKAEQLVNQTSEAILKNGYYEVNGFKFSEFYYKKLWTEGRGAPSLVAREILDHAKIIAPDIKLPDFFRYEHGGWEMVYNPATKEIWHLQPIKMK